MYKLIKNGDSGLSLAETLVALGLLCIFIVPAANMLRQSAVNYSRAYANYQMDLALAGLLAHVKDSVDTRGVSEVDVDFSVYPDNGRYEYEIIIEDSIFGQTVIRYPAGGDLGIQPAGLDRAGVFAGLITAAVKDSVTGLIKVKAQPYSR